MLVQIGLSQTCLETKLPRDETQFCDLICTSFSAVLSTISVTLTLSVLEAMIVSVLHRCDTPKTRNKTVNVGNFTVEVNAWEIGSPFPILQLLGLGII